MIRKTFLRNILAILSTIVLSLNIPASSHAFEMAASRPVFVDFTQNSSTNANLKLDFGELSRQDFVNQGEHYDRFPIEGQPLAGPAGRPELPSVVKFVLIPPESGVSLTVKSLRTHLVNDVNPYPRQPEPLEKDIKNITDYEASLATADLVRDEEFYAENAFWPNDHVSLGEPQIIRGYRLIPVRFNPLRYNPVTRELEVVDDIEVEFDFNSNENRTNLVRNPGKPRYSENVEKILKEIVVNPPAELDRDNLGIRGGSILYVLGSGNQWNAIRDELKPLILWRQKMGWVVDTLRLNNVGDANATRRAIQEYYDAADVPPEHIVICGDTDGNFPFAFFNHANGANFPYESDHDYGMLEGDDILPEASVGRLNFDSANRLRGIVNKTIQYEAAPFLGNGNAAGWQARGAVESITSRSGISSIDMCRWSKEIMLQNGYTRVNELYWEQAGADRDNRQFVFDNINGGCSIFLHRGYLWMGTFQWGDPAQLRNGGMLPLVMAITCNTGDYGEHISDGGNGYFNESFSFNANGGAIGAIGCAGATHTAYNNIYCTETIRAINVEGLHNQGWAHEAGKMALYTHYANRGDINHEENRNMEAWLTELYITNLMGDPAVDLFTAVPRALAVSRPQTIRQGETQVSVNVLHDDDDSPAIDATVCFFKRGDFQIVKSPDAEGNVVFDLDPSWTEADSVHLTITGHNLLTSHTSWVIGQAGDFVGASTFDIDDDNNGASRGNGNGDANQLETIELTVNVANLGENDYDGELTVTLEAADPNLEVLDDQIVLNQTPAHGESEAVNFLVRIGGGFPSGQMAVFNMAASVGENTWRSSISIPVTGPKLVFESLDWADAPLHRAENAELNVTLHNIGSSTVAPFRATFFSRIATIGPVVADADFDRIDPDETGESNSMFRVSAHPFHIGSKPVPVGLAIEANDGFIDTVLFEMPISDVVDGEPFGPDDYGYICFDNNDTNWFAVPTYNFIEIDPRHDGEGTNTDLRDAAEGADQSVVVDLPFDFQYYGETFDQITVCSNGWIAMGDYHQLNSARNRQIPGGECPPGMIAPFWEDLIIPQNSGVYTWYDEANGWFIVEWSRLRKLGPRGANEPTETFQVHLLDPEEHPSFTGDGDIIFQYLDITDNQSCFQEWDTPFASVGICSPDVSTGLEYTYWNDYAGGAEPLHNGLAIKFTTLVSFETGSLSGRVFDAATGLPLDSARITTTYGFSAMTDENGEFQIDEMLVDSNYTFIASKRFYNDSALVGEIIKDETTYVEFGLRHPEFTLSSERSDFIMLRDSIANRPVMIHNTGNGRLIFSSRYGYEIEGANGGDHGRPNRDDPDETWDILRRWEFSQITGNPKIQCLAYLDDHWLVGGSRPAGDTVNYWYTFSREGELLETFPQPYGVGSSFGFRDMDYTNGELWAVSNDTAVCLMNKETGEIIQPYSTQSRYLRNVRCIARDPHSLRFYLSGVTGRISVAEVDEDTVLTIVHEFEPMDPRSGTSIRKSGFAWFEDDPDGFKLYIAGTNEVPANDPSHPDLALFKMNTETDSVIFVTDLADQVDSADASGCGIMITHTWSNRVYALAMAIERGANDWIGIFEIAPNSSWISYSPKSDTLEEGEEVPIELEINSTALDTGIYEILLDYTHNAAPGFQRFPVQLHVVYELPPVAVPLPDLLPLAFGLSAPYPNPFNETTTIRFSLEAAGVTKLRVYDLAGREVAALYDKSMKPGRYATTFGSAGFASGVYICRLESGGKTAIQKMILMK